jgi:hypothetical protein
MRKQIVECNECGCKFEVNEKRCFEDKYQGKDYGYFMCPKCNYKYVFMVRTLDLEARYADLCNRVAKEGISTETDKIKSLLMADIKRERELIECAINQ